MVTDYLSPRHLAAQGLFRAEVVEEMLNAHWAGRHDYSRNIWNLLMFSLWHERYAAGPLGEPSAAANDQFSHELHVSQGAVGRPGRADLRC